MPLEKGRQAAGIGNGRQWRRRDTSTTCLSTGLPSRGRRNRTKSLRPRRNTRVEAREFGSSLVSSVEVVQGQGGTKAEQQAGKKNVTEINTATGREDEMRWPSKNKNKKDNRAGSRSVNYLRVGYQVELTVWRSERKRETTSNDPADPGPASPAGEARPLAQKVRGVRRGTCRIYCTCRFSLLCTANGDISRNLLSRCDKGSLCFHVIVVFLPVLVFTDCVWWGGDYPTIRGPF